MPDIIADFGIWMPVLRGQTNWLDVIDFEALIKIDGTDDDAITPETPVFVDVGGGIGSQCAILKAKLPNLPGRVILQDLPVALQHALPTEGVEIMAHNFWTEQPVKGGVTSRGCNGHIQEISLTCLNDTQKQGLITFGPSSMTILTIKFWLSWNTQLLPWGRILSSLSTISLFPIKELTHVRQRWTTL